MPDDRDSKRGDMDDMPTLRKSFFLSALSESRYCSDLFLYVVAVNWWLRNPAFARPPLPSPLKGAFHALSRE